jgi:hypothetical protein
LDCTHQFGGPRQAIGGDLSIRIGALPVHGHNRRHAICHISREHLDPAISCADCFRAYRFSPRSLCWLTDAECKVQCCNAMTAIGKWRRCRRRIDCGMVRPWTLTRRQPPSPNKSATVVCGIPCCGAHVKQQSAATEATSIRGAVRGFPNFSHHAGLLLPRGGRIQPPPPCPTLRPL